MCIKFCIKVVLIMVSRLPISKSQSIIQTQQLYTLSNIHQKQGRTDIKTLGCFLSELHLQSLNCCSEDVLYASKILASVIKNCHCGCTLYRLCDPIQHISVLEISQLDLEVWCSETLPDARSVLGNLAGISV